MHAFFFNSIQHMILQQRNGLGSVNESKGATQVQNCHVSGQAKMTFQCGESANATTPSGVHCYLCLSGMLDPAALNRKVVSKFIQTSIFFLSSFYKSHTIGGKFSFMKVLVALRRAGWSPVVVVRRAQLTWSWCTW